MGSHYWKTMEEKEFQRVLEEELIVQLNDRKIENEDELAELVGEEIQKKEKINSPQWRLYVKENYQKDKSLMVLKMHHVMTDAYGMAGLLGCIMDTPEAKDGVVLPQLKKLS